MSTTRGLVALVVVVAVLVASPGLCSTPSSPGVAALVESLSRAVNVSADPCEDFFQFACGGYVASTDILPHLDSVSVVAQMEDQLRQQLHDLLAEPPAEREPAAFTKAKTLYRSCVNTSLLEQLGLEPARKVLSELGGWPLIDGDAWDESKFDWRELTYKLVDMGMYGDYLFGFGLDRDISDTTKYSIEVGMPDLILDLKALDDEAASISLGKYLSEVAVAVSMLLENNTAPFSPPVRGAILEVAFFERDLNARTRSLEDRRNLTLSVNHMNVSELQERYPFVQWREYIRRVLPPAANITEAETVNVADTGYMDALGALLADTPKRTLANYLVWRVLEADVLPYLNARARGVFVQSRSSRSGRGGQRSDECVKLVQQSMRMATSAMYVRRHSTREARTTVREMARDISEEMHRLLEAVEWMDPATRRAAILKADMMRYNVAFPDELLNDTVLDELYERVEVHPDRLLENTMSLQRDDHMRNARRFRTSVKRQDWTYISGYADIVNAFYAHGDNSLSLPAGILQGAFFQSDRPQYMNFGAIGFVIGHEVSHGFDETGSLFDADGMMEDWWDDDTKQRFDEKVRCVVELYGRLRSEEVNATVNGVLTQSENIADNAALKLAYRAYRRYVARHGPEAPVELPRAPPLGPPPSPEEPEALSNNSLRLAAPPATPASASPQLPPLVLQPGQMFWLSFASVWCSKESNREMNRKLRTSSHLPGVHRVNGAVRNQEAFAADFNCPVGSPMNPAHKCQVW